MTTPPPAAGVRLPWEQLPPRVRGALEDWIGAPIVDVAMQHGGFSPATAARVRARNGRRVFIKAVSPEQNPDSPTIFRWEAGIVGALPEDVPCARLLWSYDEGPAGWVMNVFEDIEGRLPAQPWVPEEFDRVFDTLIQLADLLTPSPISAPLASDHLDRHICGWKFLTETDGAQLDPWASRHLEDLVRLEAEAPAAAHGDTLLHFDYRADNVLLTDDRVVVVDWPAASVGTSWLDVIGFAPSALMNGAPISGEEMLLRHPAARAADPDAVTAVIAALAGYFTHRALLPPPPGLPTLRAFQAAQGVVTREWLRERTGWE